VLEETGLLKNNAAKNILQDIKQTIGRDLSWLICLLIINTLPKELLDW
jgi:hypothetical protein